MKSRLPNPIRNKFLPVAFGLIFAASGAHPAFASIKSLRRHRPFRVVIDPGHGGVDLGTVYKTGTARIMEKDATLLLSEQVARQLRARGFSVILTRTEDVEVPLGRRTAIANRLGADIFISIHMNTTPDHDPNDGEGIETYILNNTTNESSRRLARLENTVLSPEVRAGDTPEQLDVALILRDLRLDANLSESKRLACLVQNHLVSVSGHTRTGFSLGHFRQRNRGVKQALFHVLLGAEMPSILVEAGFLSNPYDRAMVLSPVSRKAMARAIALAVVSFRDHRDTPKALATLSRCQIR